MIGLKGGLSDSDDSFDRLGESSEDERRPYQPANKVTNELSEQTELGTDDLKSLMEPAVSQMLEEPLPKPQSQEPPKIPPRPTTGGKSLINILNLMKKGKASVLDARLESRRDILKRMNECSAQIEEFFEANKEIITFDK